MFPGYQPNVLSTNHEVSYISKKYPDFEGSKNTTKIHEAVFLPVNQDTF